ncbi:hypothetical protein HID58_077861 [Brassica napus]|uniref:WRKY domain-containing protein n=1 Tax=Brassica napus TaxID=3708 RepID=A0ABQ7YSL9_BRANA|nr:hypothetical protein HID58_077861 [Brassica napus]
MYNFYNYQFPSSFSLYEMMNLPTSAPSSYGNNGFDPSSYSFTDCLQSSPGAYDSLLQKTFGLSPSSSEVFNSSIDQESKRDVTNDVTGETPTRVSAPSSSSEADHPGEDSGKSQIRKRELAEDGGEENQNSKKVSYYRCTTQKCNVKKRVERSFQDPTVVITTYEGQHNHPIPTNLRGSSAAAAMYSDFMTPRSFTHDMFRTAAYTSGGSVEGALDYGYGQSGYGSVNANPNSSHQNYHQGGSAQLTRE